MRYVMCNIKHNKHYINYMMYMIYFIMYCYTQTISNYKIHVYNIYTFAYIKLVYT